MPSKEGPHKDATNFRNKHFSLKKAYVLYTSFVGGSGRFLVSIVASFSSLEENVKKKKEKKLSLYQVLAISQKYFLLLQTV